MACSRVSVSAIWPGATVEGTGQAPPADAAAFGMPGSGGAPAVAVTPAALGCDCGRLLAQNSANRAMTTAARTPAAALTRPDLVSRRVATGQRCQTRRAAASRPGIGFVHGAWGTLRPTQPTRPTR